jgi:hypothetical protein
VPSTDDDAYEFVLDQVRRKAEEQKRREAGKPPGPPPAAKGTYVGPGALIAAIRAARDRGDFAEWLARGRQVAKTMGLEDRDLLRDLDRWVEDQYPWLTPAVRAAVVAVMAAEPDRGNKGFGSLTKLDVLTLVLVWLLMLGSPVAQRYLPPEDQTVITNEYATIALGLAITTVILGLKRSR